MPYLAAVSLLWAFSFGLTKGLTAGLDGAFIAAVRLSLAFLVFVPFLRLGVLSARTIATLTGIGAVQFGVMYLAYNESFRHLAAHEVAVLTLTTPVFVTLLADAFERTFRLRALVAALLAIAGTVVVAYGGQSLSPTLTGLAWIQLSNLSFAFGQVAYRRLRQGDSALRDRDIIALLYAGALALTLPFAVLRHDPATFSLTLTQVKTLLYLGVVASGVGFFLWNVGSTKVSAGTLAVMNNAKIPLAVGCSLLFFGESADLPRLALSLALLAVAVWLAEKRT